jgi:hypothetical protein
MTKMPGRKTRCPNCGDYVYVRARPSDRRKVLLTKEQVDQVERLWDILYEAQQAQFLDWSLCNRLLAESTQKRNWGIYRNTRFSMAQILIRARNYKAALETLLEVSYLDANGPENTSGLEDPRFPPFNRKRAFQAPAIVEYIQILTDWLDLTQQDLKKLYFRLALRLRSQLNLPVSPEDGWHDLEFELAEIHKEIVPFGNESQ